MATVISAAERARREQAVMDELGLTEEQAAFAVALALGEVSGDTPREDGKAEERGDPGKFWGK